MPVGRVSRPAPKSDRGPRIPTPGRILLGASRNVLDALEDFGRFSHFARQAVGAMPGAAISRPLACARQFERVLWGTLPIAAAAGLSVGLVTWLQMHRLLVAYGVQDTLPSVLAAAVLVETGPMLASLLVAGRMGAGLGGRTRLDDAHRGDRRPRGAGSTPDRHPRRPPGDRLHAGRPAADGAARRVRTASGA